MGNAITVPVPLSVSGTGKVLLSDGTVHEYDKPVTVAELMLEHPQQVVIEFPVNVNDRKRPAPLPADKNLEMNKVYVMIPMRRGKPAASLSSEEARRILLKANMFLKSKSLLSFSSSLRGGVEGLLPLFGRMCATGMLSGEKRSQEEMKKLHYGGGEESNDNRSTSAEDCFREIMMEERPEFLSRQVSGKGWKPSLDTITEKTVHGKVRHWLF